MHVTEGLDLLEVKIDKILKALMAQQKEEMLEMFNILLNKLTAMERVEPAFTTGPKPSGGGGGGVGGIKD